MALSTKIIFAADFSEFCESGLRYATELARLTGSRLIIVHVEEVDRYSGEAQIYEGLPHHGPTAAELLAGLEPPDAAVAYERRLLQGRPAEEIVRCAAEEGAELIVIGTHGRRGFRRWILGSVAELVVRNAGCSVLTVRQTIGPN